MSSLPRKGDSFWIGPAFFLLAAAPGFWIPVLSNVLDEQGWNEYAMWAFFIIPASSIISPLIFAARADQAIAAEKLLGIIVGSGSILLWLTFETLMKGENPKLFLLFLGLNALVTAPAWSLLTAITLNHLDDPARHFGKFRVWGTFGWMFAGWTISFLALDKSPEIGKLAIIVRLLGAVCCFLLPHTPPAGGPPKKWTDILGWRAVGILRERDMAVYFGTAFLFSVPLAAFYLHTPRHLDGLNVDKVGALMTIGQVTEAFAMVLMGWFLTRWRIKWLLALAITAGIARYSLNAIGAWQNSSVYLLAGIAFHGICWSYFFEAGKVFLEKRVDLGIRSQCQALLTFMTSGLGGVIGALTVGWIHKSVVNETTGEGWDTYWWILTGFCVICLIGFLIGYQGRTPSTPESKGN